MQYRNQNFPKFETKTNCTGFQILEKTNFCIWNKVYMNTKIRFFLIFVSGTNCTGIQKLKKSNFVSGTNCTGIQKLEKI